MIMYSRIIILFLIFIFSNYLKGENELLKVKIDVKLSKSNIINKKNVGEDEILSGVFYGKTESKEDKNFSQLIEGIELTEEQIINVFEKFKIEKIKSINEKFDPNLHQAMFELEKDGIEEGTVAEVVQEGYTIGERLLRPALVGVSKKKSEQNQ